MQKIIKRILINNNRATCRYCIRGYATQSRNASLMSLNSHLSKFYQSRQTFECHALLCLMVNDLQQYNNLSFQIVMRAYDVFDNDYKRILQLFEDMKRLGRPYDVATSNFVFKAILYEQSERDALEFAQKIHKQCQHFPDHSTLTTLLLKYKKLNDYASAKYMWNYMSSTYGNSILSSHQNLQTMVELACRCGHVLEAVELIEQFRNMFSIQPNSFILTSVLHGYCQMSMMEEAEDLLTNQKTKYNVSPCSIDYSVIIQAYQKLGNQQKVDHWKSVKVQLFGEESPGASKVLAMAYRRTL